MNVFSRQTLAFAVQPSPYRRLGYAAYPGKFRLVAFEFSKRAIKWSFHHGNA